MDAFDDPADRNEPFALRADWVVPIGDAPIEGGVITICDGRITAVGENLSGRQAREMPGCAILPGLVNAHTHLEFSSLLTPLGTPGMEFSAWIESVLSHRAGLEADAATAKQTAILQGLAESARHGVTSLGDISTGGWMDEAGPAAEIVIYQELIGLSAEHYDRAKQLAAANLVAAQPISLQWGLSPHAPYTLSDSQIEEVTSLAQQRQCPLAMHLAESPAEVELLTTGQGALRALLERRGVWSDALLPQGNRLAKLVGLIVAAEGCVVHGNYLPAKLIHAAGRLSDSPCVIYCPRTHDYFRHRQYPMWDYLSAGWTVALGTDSRASNPDLSILAEMKLVRQQFPDLEAEKILRMGTLNGAISLRQTDRAGELREGAIANLAIVKLGGNAEQRCEERLLADDSRVVATLWRGQTIYREV